MHWWTTKLLPQVQIQIFKQENHPHSPHFWSYSVHKSVVVNVYLIHVNYNSLVNRHLADTENLELSELVPAFLYSLLHL